MAALLSASLAVALLVCVISCMVVVANASVAASEQEEQFPSLYVCEASDSKFLGVYAAGREKMDGAPIYSNEKDMSFYRNKGFWYLGDLAPWPPATHFRCVEAEGCNFQGQVPPTSTEGAWKGSKKYNDGSAPRVSRDPCNTSSFDEL